MKIGLPGFQPATLYNNFVKTQVKQSDSSALPQQNYQSDAKGIAAKVMQNKLADALSMPENIKAKNESLFDFEEVAKNVLGFVKGAVLKAKNDGADESKLRSMLDEAKKGIAIGIEDAKHELEDAGFLTDDIKEGIKQSDALMSDGLDKFAQELFKTPQKDIYSNYRQASQYSLSNGAQLSIKTLDGDEIKITFNAEYAEADRLTLNVDDQGKRMAMETSSAFSYGFSLEINGEIDEEEQQAINALMEDLQGVSDLFFNGDLDQAFNKATELSMDPSQLAGFSMNLQQTEMMSSVKEYQRNIPGSNIAEQLKPLNEGLGQAFTQAKSLKIDAQLVGLIEWLNQDKDSKQLNTLLEYTKVVFEQYSLLDQETNKADKKAE
ncbi:DUF5610 domain-containing protein [Pseudoalteromonas tunicata]|uniref:DUF5610 domain-containing protein n=1 Tax=Pseudoalteromonas tunicata TaxID=314281 RepID=UPI00273F5A1D|nr:DUF5610 domain-containing protein [Pseudoalteromonas tunicata]MDP4985580.1 DUF5610 domain-containing protein [Pseudoalteromonas tunicata]